MTWGTLIEQRLGWYRFAGLVLVIAIASNGGQYTASGPNFYGMSGVVYGLFGYAWVRGRLYLTSGMYLRPDIAFWMMVWFAACAIGLIGNVANWAHGVGLATGAVLGYLPQVRRFLHENTLPHAPAPASVVSRPRAAGASRRRCACQPDLTFPCFAPQILYHVALDVYVACLCHDVAGPAWLRFAIVRRGEGHVSQLRQDRCKDPRFDKLVPVDLRHGAAGRGVRLVRRARMDPDGGYLLFSDIPQLGDEMERRRGGSVCS